MLIYWTNTFSIFLLLLVVAVVCNSTSSVYVTFYDMSRESWELIYLFGDHFIVTIMEKVGKIIIIAIFPCIEYQSALFKEKTSLFSFCFLYFITQDNLLIWIHMKY